MVSKPIQDMLGTWGTCYQVTAIGPRSGCPVLGMKGVLRVPHWMR